eukprot:scaffold8259_cov143-Cylindrotheca_fusiformis.AAC.17
MENPPIPRLPPASQLRKYDSSPPDFLSPIQQYAADNRSQEYVYDAWEAATVRQKFSLLRKALRIFPFSVDALNAWASIYAHKLHPPELEKAEKTYELALASSRLLWPDLEQQPTIEWGHVEHRPFLRAYHGLAVVQSDLGKTSDAIEKYQYLLKVNPNDNQGVRNLLFSALLENGEYKLAEEIAEKHEEGRKSQSTLFRYGFVIIDFLKYKLGVCSEDDLVDTLAKALMCNNYVPSLLLGDIDLPQPTDGYSPGCLDEAESVVHSTKCAWERVAGLMDWLRVQQYFGGKKPDDDGSILFNLLRKGKVLVNKMHPDALLEVSTCIALMPGTALPDFYLAPGMKKHNPKKIVCYNYQRNSERNVSRFVSFSYDEVVSVPFWKVLLSSRAFGNEDDVDHYCGVCYESAPLRCSACSAVWYCSRSCQKKDWKNGHKTMCPRFVKS